LISLKYHKDWAVSINQLIKILARLGEWSLDTINI
jgi:hypothetical protein